MSLWARDCKGLLSEAPFSCTDAKLSPNYYARPHRAEATSDDARLTYVWRLSVAYIRPKSRTERPRKTKMHRGRPRHTWLGHHFQGQKVKGNSQGAVAYCGGLPHCSLWTYAAHSRRHWLSLVRAVLRQVLGRDDETAQSQELHQMRSRWKLDWRSAQLPQ